MNEDALATFVAQASAWKVYLRACVRIALSVFTDGQWAIWYSYSAFLPEVPDHVDAFTVETNSIRAFREVLIFRDESEVDAVLSDLSDQPEIVRSIGWSASLAPTAKHLQFEYESLHPDRFAGPKRLPALTAHWTNPHYKTLTAAQVKLIDHELQLYREPYDGFGDLAAALNIPTGLDELNKRRFSEFVLISPVELLLDSSKDPCSQLRNGALSLVMAAPPALSPENLRVGVKAFRQKGAPERLTLAPVARGPDGLLRLEHNLSTSDVPLALVFISLAGGDLLGRWFIRDFGNSFNDRMLLHRAMDTRDQLKSSFEKFRLMRRTYWLSRQQGTST